MSRGGGSLGIAGRLTLVVSLSTTVILAVVLGIDYRRSLATLEIEIDRNARTVAHAAANALEGTLKSVATSAKTLAAALELAKLDGTALAAVVAKAVSVNPDVLGGGVYLTPQTTDSGQRLAESHYCHRDEGRISCLNTADGEALWSRAWLRLPAASGQTRWSEPYFDGDFAQVVMTTLSAPFFDTSGPSSKLAGVVTADLALDWLTQEVSRITLLKTGYALLLSPSGVFMAHPRAELPFRESIASMPQALGADERPEIRSTLLGDAPGRIDGAHAFGQRARLYHAPIASAGWTLVLVVPEDEIDDEVRALTLTTSVVGIAGIVLMLAAILVIARTITRPLRELAAATGEVAAGRFDMPLPARERRDEVGDLARGFAGMTRELRDYIDRLTRATAARQQIESELQIAHDIQMAILPRVFPPSSGQDAIALCALIEPAREVGGDFYDFFAIDETHVCVVIADVSGKGVPASLFMAVTKTLIKATAKPGRSPGEVLTRVNDELARDNDLSMFVTVFCGILDRFTGQLWYANAGHNPPTRIGADGRVEPVPPSGQLVLGAMPGVQYRDECLWLAPRDRLFLYTDGVTEAMSASDELYSATRLHQALVRCSRESIEAVAAAVVQDVRDFVGEAPQSDDITLMLLEYVGTDSSLPC